MAYQLCWNSNVYGDKRRQHKIKSIIQKYTVTSQKTTARTNITQSCWAKQYLCNKQWYNYKTPTAHTTYNRHDRCTLTLYCFCDAWLPLSESNSHSPLVGHQGWLPQLAVSSCFQITSDAVTSHSCKPTTSVQLRCL